MSVASVAWIAYKTGWYFYALGRRDLPARMRG